MPATQARLKGRCLCICLSLHVSRLYVLSVYVIMPVYFATDVCFDRSSMLIPGNAAGVAKQFLRCVLHQLAPNGILPQLFQSNIKGNQTSAHAYS